ncbi:MAG TPA: M13 family metallopeptidase [Thermoanaerobaculia bacterium]|jgi:predicted metalloendopeptidase
MRFRAAAVLVLSFAGIPLFAQPAAPAKPKAIDPADFDASAKPCEDFYQFANGAWLAAHPIPADRSSYGGFEQLRDRNREVVKKILDETSGKADWPKGTPQQKVSDFYATGMDAAAREKAGAAPLAPSFATIAKLKSADDLPAVLAELHLTGANAGFGFRVAPDARDSTRTIGVFSQGGLGLPDRDYYLKDDAKSKDLREAYRAHVAKVLELVGDAPETARAGADVVLAIETQLAKVSITRVENRDPQKTYNKKTLAALNAEAPGFDFAKFLADMGASASTEVNVRQPGFFVGFAAYARSIPPADWRTYLRWHAARAAAPFLSKAFQDEDFAFSGKKLNGTPEQEPTWRRVQAATDMALGEAVGPIYVARAFSPKAKERMRVLVENMRAALKERIEALPWMGAETKAQAQRKLAAFNVKIGYPDVWKDYSALTISRDVPFAENVRRARVFETKRNLAKLGKPIDRKEWNMTPPTVNAYYNASLNEIVFPAGILQPPFFYEDADDAVNYGGIGVVIGHEMSHGFDDSGSQYDADGNLKNWWTAEDRKAYDARTALIVKQFDAYKPLPDQAINGKLTLGENIGDLGGIKVAYAAMQKAYAGKSKEKIDGFTPEQRFFLSYATIWRSQYRDEAMRVQLNTNPHSPGKWRALGPPSNLPEFYDAFGCADGTPMRRAEADRPSIW